MKIAIDGPAGAGKSTVARMIAKVLGFVYIDTGAMYRALTWKALQKEIALSDHETLYQLALTTEINFQPAAEIQKVICDGEDVTEAIRSPQVNASVAIVAAHARVREIMVKKQQTMANFSSVVMDGRDIGEQVLPDAEYKFYITASLEERARRRIVELQAQGFAVQEEVLEQEMEDRDRMDCERAVGALKVLPDAILIDTSLLSIDEVLQKMLAIIGEK